MAKDDYVDPVDVGFAAVMLAIAVYVLISARDLGQAAAFGLAGVVLGLISVTVLRGRFALLGLALWIIGGACGVAVSDGSAGAAYGLLFAATVSAVPRGFRNARSGRGSRTAHDSR